MEAKRIAAALRTSTARSEDLGKLLRLANLIVVLSQCASTPLLRLQVRRLAVASLHWLRLWQEHPSKQPPLDPARVRAMNMGTRSSVAPAHFQQLWTAWRHQQQPPSKKSWFSLLSEKISPEAIDTKT